MPELQNVEPFASYSPEDVPHGSYLALVTAYGGLVGGYLAWTRRTGRTPARLRWSDLLLYGAATHEITRVLAQDRITTPFRAPFTRKEPKDGEVKERTRGRGLRRALGELLSCQYCCAPWVALALTGAATVRPKQTRFVAQLFAVAATSDALHRSYDWLRERKAMASLEKERAGASLH